MGGRKLFISHRRNISSRHIRRYFLHHRRTARKRLNSNVFDYRPYGTELLLCQRYFNIYSSSDAQFPIGIAGSTTTVNRYTIPTPVTMRATPTVATSGTLVLYDNVATTNVTSIATIKILANFVSFDITVASGLTQYRPYMLLIQGTTLSLTSEL
jgi:hypothetical protein